MNPEVANHTWVTWVVLFVAFVLEGGAGLVAVRSISASAKHANVSFKTYLREGRDPTATAVLLEDSAAVFGLILAAVGIGLAEATGWPGWDAWASILIGVLLAFVAIFLVATNRQFLLDRSVDSEVTKRLRAAIEGHEGVESVQHMTSVIGSMDRYKVSAEIDFDGEFIAKELLKDRDMNAIYASIDSPAALKKLLVEFSDEVIDQLGDVVDSVEEHVRRAVPEAQDIDIESD